MALFLVATPIGDPQDISLRALDLLKNAEVIILEERKEGTAFLRAHGISGKHYEQLNEHSTPEDLAQLVEICRSQQTALITDCGTPGFADPGADLVRLCRKNSIRVHSLPGASSLMTLLSYSGRRIDSFLFRGFLSAENEERRRQWLELKKEKRPIVIMDTPYRLQKTLTELAEHFPERQMLIGVNMTQESEQIVEGPAIQVKKQILVNKAEFMVLLYSQS